jgi:intraflagellar transport protein 56
LRLYNGKAAESEMKLLLLEKEGGATAASNDLIRHNMVVFSNGESSMQVLPYLLDTVPEARLNLVIFHLRRDNVQEAYALMKDFEPTSSQEFILKGVVYTSLGQQTSNNELLKQAQTYFQAVGTSAHECDTIPGRQAMASFFFLVEQFDDVNVYLNSIKAYLYNDDEFNYNYGVSLAATRQYKVAEETLLQVKSEKYRAELVYIQWITKCFIMNGNPRSAWEMYLKMSGGGYGASALSSKKDNHESLTLLRMIANDCYKVSGQRLLLTSEMCIVLINYYIHCLYLKLFVYGMHIHLYLLVLYVVGSVCLCRSRFRHFGQDRSNNGILGREAWSMHRNISTAHPPTSTQASYHFYYCY